MEKGCRFEGEERGNEQGNQGTILQNSRRGLSDRPGSRLRWVYDRYGLVCA